MLNILTKRSTPYTQYIDQKVHTLCSIFRPKGTFAQYIVIFLVKILSIRSITFSINIGEKIALNIEQNITKLHILL